MNLDKLREQYNSYLKTDSYIPQPKAEKQQGKAAPVPSNNLTEQHESLNDLQKKLKTKIQTLKPKKTTNPRKLAKQAKKAASASKKIKKVNFYNLNQK